MIGMLHENFIHSKFIKIKYKIISTEKKKKPQLNEKITLYRAFMIQIKRTQIITIMYNVPPHNILLYTVHLTCEQQYVVRQNVMFKMKCLQRNLSYSTD